jgi:D-xylose transport system substrate-binding protein
VLRSTRSSRWAVLGAAAVLALSGVAAGCGDDEEEGTGGGSTETSAEGGGEQGKVAVLLPDSKSSVRWETVDRPFLKQAFDDAGIEAEIVNAEGDKSTQQQQAEQAITNGATVILMVNLDSGSGAAIAANAASQDVKVIDYDRLTLDTDATDYYVSFDNEAVGRLQGEGLVSCIEEAGTESPEIAVLNGSPTDNNATLFKQGYDSKIDPKFDSGEWTKVDDQSVPDWDNQKGGQIFEQMLASANGSVDGVLAANDGLGGAAIAVLKKNQLQVPVTGQDATVDGLRNILTGDQCMTVYKAIKAEADAAAAAAVALAKGEAPATNGTTTDTQTNTEIPSVLAEPVAIYNDSVKDVIADGFVTKGEVCKDLAAECEAAGIA